MYVATTAKERVFWQFALPIISLFVFIGAGYYIGSGGNPQFAVLLAAAPLVILLFRNLFVGVLLLVFLIPLETAFFSISAGAVTYTRLLGIAVFGVWILKLVTKHYKMPTLPPTMKWIGIYSIWAIISYFWAWDQSVTLARISTQVQLVLLSVLLVGVVNDKKKLWQILVTLFFSCILAALFGLVGISVSQSSAVLVLEGQNPREYATYVGITILFSILLFTLGPIRFRWIAVAAIVLTVYPLFAIGQRGVLLAMGVSLLATILIGRHKPKLLIGSVLAIGLLYGSFQFLESRALFSDYLVNRYDINSIVESRGSSRLDIWAVGLVLGRDNLLIGTGLDNFKVAFEQYLPLTETERRLKPGRDPHSNYLQIVGDLGLIGLSIWVIVLISAIRPFVPLLRRNAVYNEQLLLIVIFSLFLFVEVAGLTSTFVWRKVYWLALTLMVIAPLLMKDDQVINDSDNSLLAKTRKGRHGDTRLL